METSGNKTHFCAADSFYFLNEEDRLRCELVETTRIMIALTNIVDECERDVRWSIEIRSPAEKFPIKFANSSLTVGRCRALLCPESTRIKAGSPRDLSPAYLPFHRP